MSEVQETLQGDPVGSNNLGMVSCPSTSSPMVELTVKVSCPSAKMMRSTKAPGGLSTVISDTIVSDRVSMVPGAVKLIAAANSSSSTRSADSATLGNISQFSAKVPEKSSVCTNAKRPPSSPTTGTVSKLSESTSKTSSKSNRVSTNGTAKMGVQLGATSSSAGCSQPLNNSTAKANIRPNLGVQDHGQVNCCIPFVLRSFPADVSQDRHLRKH